MRFTAAIFSVLLTTVLSSTTCATPQFLTHNLNNAAYQDEHGFLRGKKHAGRRAFYVEVVYAMMQQRQAVRPVKEVSLGRGFHLLQRETGYAFFNVVRNAERNNKFKWVGPVDTIPTYFYELASAPTGIQSVDDAKNVGSICTLNGNNLTHLLERMQFDNILRANSNEACAKLLKYGRVSLITGSEYPWFTLDEELSTALVRTPVTLTTNEGYIAFSTATKDTEVALWQAALDSIKASGRYDELRAEYLMAPASQ